MNKKECRYENCQNPKAIISQWGDRTHYCLQHLKELFNNTEEIKPIGENDGKSI